MAIGRFEINEVCNEVMAIATNIVGVDEIKSVTRICERYGEKEDDFRKYNVYKIKTDAGERILKKAPEREVNNYENYLRRRGFNVPEYYGSYNDGKDLWIVLESIEGSDLRDMTDELARGAAESISGIQNAFWNNTDKERFESYIERIERRYSYIIDKPIVGKAYGMFVERQKTCPRTMSNGDFLQFNAACNNGKVIIIDWGFGGVMPYSLDLARFIAHATEDRATFPFYMNDDQKKIFVDGVYDRLKEKPDYQQYLHDIKLAILNEYVEFIEADEDEDDWYMEHATKLAKELLGRA